MAKMWKYISRVSEVVDEKKNEKAPIQGSARRLGPRMWLKYDEDKGWFASGVFRTNKLWSHRML